MAAVHASRHPHPHQHSISTSSTGSNHSPFRRVHRAAYVPPPAGKSSSASAAAASSSTSSRTHHSHQAAPPPCIDSYYGHEDTSKICARFVCHTFNCPELLPLAPSANPTSTNSTAVVSRSNGTTAAGPQPPTIPNTLAHFVAYALHRTRLHPSVVFTALALLHRLKSRFPAARGSSGHRLFLAAYMLASKVVCDDTYSNKSWAVVGQGMFALREINQMEREMLGYLEWGLNIPGEDLAKFEKEVRRIYGSNGGGRDGSGNGRDGWGRGVEMRLTAGVGGASPPQDDSVFETNSLALPIPSTGAITDKNSNSPYQLPTPTEAGPAAVPISRPIVPRISTDVQKPHAYPSPPMSPPSVATALNAMCDSDSSSASTSPADADSDREESDCEEETYPYHARPRLVPDHGEDGSPSPTSSEDSAALPTPPNSALSAGPHRRASSRGYPGYAQKMGKSQSVPGFMYAPRDNSREHIGRSSAPPVSASKREPVVSSVTASHFGSFSANMEEDGDAVMELEDEKRGGMAYYATVHHPAVPRPASSIAVPSRSSAVAASRKDFLARDTRETRECGRREKEREGKNLKTYTVPCAW